MTKVYFISGLGADQRVFEYLDIKDAHLHHIQWEDPHPKETIPAYAHRLIDQIDTSSKIILVGMSFGGIVAQEISKILDVERTIIISSIKSKNELDWRMRLVAALKLHRLVPGKVLKWSNLATADYYFSTQNQFESRLLKAIINDTDELFMKWAIDAIMHWNNDNIDEELIHIHGTRDRIFPIKSIQGAIEIEDGGHFMIVNMAREITAKIEAHL